MSEDARWEKVWPSDRITDAETDQFLQRGEVLLSYAVEIGDIIHMADECDIDFENVRFKIVGSTTGLAVEVSTAEGTFHKAERESEDG